MSGTSSIHAKRGPEAISILQQMLVGGRIESVKRVDSHLVFQLQNGIRFDIEPWGDGVLPVQVSIGDTVKPYYQGSFSRTEGLVLFVRGSLESR